MTDPLDFLNLISTGGPSPGLLDDTGVNNMQSTSVSQGTSDQFFNMDNSYQNFNNRQSDQKLHHLDGQSSQQFQPKLSHYANPMLANQQSNPFPNASNTGKQPSQNFSGMPMSMASPTQYNSPPPGNSPTSTWRAKSNVGNAFGNFMSQQPQPAQDPRMPGQAFPVMTPQQNNIQKLQHFMTNKQANPLLSQSQNPFLSQASGTTLTDISNSTPKLSTETKPTHLSPNVQQYSNDANRPEQFNKFHQLIGGPSTSSSSETATNTVTSGFPSTGNTFTSSPDPFMGVKTSQAMYPMQQNTMPSQPSVQSSDPFSTQTPVAGSMPQDFLARRQGQFPDGGFSQIRQPFQQQQMLNKSNPQQISGQLKSAHILYQLQRLQQQITQVRDLPSPGRDQPLQQLQQQFSRLYHMYLMDQQRQKQQFQAAQMNYGSELLKQQQQDKANRIVAEAIAKSALMNNSFKYQMDPQNMKYFNQPYGQVQKGPMNYDMKQDLVAQRKAAEPIVLPPSIVNQLPKTVRSSSKPPATVLNKPVVNRQRRDSSDHEPSPPNSPSFYQEEFYSEPSYNESSITRRSLRERKKKTYKDDFDYNLSEEEDGGGGGANKDGQPGIDAGGIPEEIPQEESLTVEKILSHRTTTTEEGALCEEFYVKYKNYSYLHCEWATIERLMKLDKRVQMKIKRFLIKKSTLPFPDEMDDEPFNPDYVEVDRVLDVSTCVDQTTKEPVSHYLVKWRSLPYDESTWEVEANVDEGAIQAYRNIQVVPQIHERQFRRRPHPSEWRKLDQTPVFKNSNTLREYQLEGLNWLTFCWYNGQNCILADEMGLGKTIQSLTFLVHVQQYGIRGPFLVIAPLSTIANWQREFETWSEINAVVHHGSAASRHLIQQYEFYFKGSEGEPVIGVYKFQVLITTYEILIADNILLSNIPWRCVIIDEAHRLKNRNCKLLEGLNNLQMEHRILLTGTPLQNNVDELFSLLNFLEPAQFPSQAAFLMEFGNLKTEAQVERLQALLRPMMLRRMKEDVEKSLAPKQETIVEVELTTVQKKFYRAILERNFSFLSKGAVSTSNVPNLMNTMMELRKCCNHPFLINGAEEKIVGEYVANVTGDNKEIVHLTSLIEASGKLVLIDKLLPKLKDGGHKVLIFSQMVRCLDILEDYLICKKYLYERIDGRVRGNLRQAAIDRFSKPDSDRFVFLLCTRAGGLGINLTAADTVIIFDSDWNPQNDLQAQARCHRIGQAKSVKVYRLITRNSYEREMFDRASMKLGLDKAVLQSMNSKDGPNAPGQNQALSKKEIEDLLRKGAYGAVMEDDEASSKFCEEDIDQILERRTQVITIDSVGQGSSFAKASFTATKKGDDIDIDDPDFWRKWAMKADIDVDELLNKDERIIDAPRQRKQTKRYGKEDDVDFELSDLESDEEAPQPKKRAWTRVECFKVEKNLLVFGWERWKDIIHAIRKRKLLEREVEAISRSILLFCVHAYRGDEKLQSFILELIKPVHTRERLASEDLDATYMPLQKGSGKKSKKNSKKGKTAGKPVNKSAIALLEAVGDWKSVNPELLILDEGYKKHLRHHCNKILLRVRLLYIMRCDVIGPMEAAVQNNCSASEVTVNLPVTEGDPPTDWWDDDADKSLVIGVYKHGYERYNAIRADPCLCFLEKCGPPTSREDPPTTDTLDAEGRFDELDSKDDPDYQLPQDRKNDEAESDDEDFDMERKEVKPAEEQPQVENETKPTLIGENDQVSGSNVPPNPAVNNTTNNANSNLLPWPSPSDLNTRLRRIVAGFQRILKKEELKRVAVEKENRRKEKVEEAVRQKELKKAEQAQKWSKREEVDFYRCVSTLGVHINPTTGDYDWKTFRHMARLDKKNDDRLSLYFRDFLAMCKRVCGRATDEEIIQSQNVEQISEERASRCLRRIELMTSLRLEVLNHPELDERLKLAQLTPELPPWWQCHKHDKDLLYGVSKHGLTRTDLNILEDPDLSFYELKSQMEAQSVVGPGNVNDMSMGSCSPESTPRSMNATPLQAFERGGEKTATENTDKPESHEESSDNQSISVVPPIPPTTPIPENGLPTPEVPRVPSEQESPTIGKQNYVQSLPSIPGSNALSSLVKQVSSLTSNPIDSAGEQTAVAQTVEKRPENPPAPGFVERNPNAIPEGAMVHMNPVLNESLAVKLWWPKDRVVFHRVQQLCHLVVTGEWPTKSERAERGMDQGAPELSVSPSSFQAYADAELEGAYIGGNGTPGTPSGLPGDPAMTEAMSKAFKIKKHDGLKVTLKKNRKRKKKEGVDGDLGLPNDPMMVGNHYPDIGYPVSMEVPSGHHLPAGMSVPPQASQVGLPGQPGLAVQMAPGQGMLLEKQKKKRQRREKGEKLPKPPTEKKKRGRKSKAEKLLMASANATQPMMVAQPDWANGSNRYLPGGEMMNGPRESPIINDVKMRTASAENHADESRLVPAINPTLRNTSVHTGENENELRPSVLKSTESTSGPGPRKPTSTSSHPDKQSPFETQNPAPVSGSPATTPTAVRLSPFNNTEFQFANNPYMNYTNYPAYANPSLSSASAGPFPPSTKTSEGSSPASSTSSISSSSQKPVSFPYEAPFPVSSATAGGMQANFGESFGFNGFTGNLSASSMNYSKLSLDEPDGKMFDSDSADEDSEGLGESEDDIIPLDPSTS